jgi:Polysulphide reductase, NrfD
VSAEVAASQGTRSGTGDGQPGRRGRGEQAMVPRAEPTSYYGRPVLKEPVWTAEIPWYFFFGGLAGAAAPLGVGADLLGNPVLARRAWGVSLLSLVASPVLLVSDLGRPERFLNMLRMFKVTSPMSVGSWILTATGPCVALGAVRAWFGWFPRLSLAGRGGALLTGPSLATYTAVLVSNTAVPAWHEGRRELPFVFAGSAMASAGAAAAAITPRAQAGPARRLAAAGAALELGATQAMERRLGEVGAPYHEGRAGGFGRAAKALSAAGAAVMAVGGRRSRAAAVLGGAAVLAGAVCTRWAFFEVGRASAADPKYTVGPQRERLAERG